MPQQIKNQENGCIAGEGCEFEICLDLGTRPPRVDVLTFAESSPTYVPEKTDHRPVIDDGNDWVSVENDLQELVRQCANNSEFDGALRIASFLEPTELTLNLLFNLLPHDNKLFELAQGIIDAQANPTVKVGLLSLRDAHLGRRAHIEGLNQKVSSNAGTMVAHDELVLLPT